MTLFLWLVVYYYFEINLYLVYFSCYLLISIWILIWFVLWIRAYLIIFCAMNTSNDQELVSPVSTPDRSVLEHVPLDIEGEIKKLSDKLKGFQIGDPDQILEFNKILENFSQSPVGIIYKQKRQIALLTSWGNEWEDDTLVQTVRKCLYHWLQYVDGYRHKISSGFFDKKTWWAGFMDFTEALSYCWSGEEYHQLARKVAYRYIMWNQLEWSFSCLAACWWDGENNIHWFAEAYVECRSRYHRSGKDIEIRNLLLLLSRCSDDFIEKSKHIQQFIFDYMKILSCDMVEKYGQFDRDRFLQIAPYYKWWDILELTSSINYLLKYGRISQFLKLRPYWQVDEKLQISTIEEYALQYLQKWDMWTFQEILSYCSKGFKDSWEVQNAAKMLLKSYIDITCWRFDKIQELLPYIWECQEQLESSMEYLKQFSENHYEKSDRKIRKSKSKGRHS